jgi:hypothetical protein
LAQCINVVIFAWPFPAKLDPFDLSRLADRREGLPFFMPASGSPEAPVA